jgi:hypothetical protein
LKSRTTWMADWWLIMHIACFDHKLCLQNRSQRLFDCSSFFAADRREAKQNLDAEWIFVSLVTGVERMWKPVLKLHVSNSLLPLPPGVSQRQRQIIGKYLIFFTDKLNFSANMKNDKAKLPGAIKRTAFLCCNSHCHTAGRREFGSFAWCRKDWAKYNRKIKELASWWHNNWWPIRDRFTILSTMIEILPQILIFLIIQFWM